MGSSGNAARRMSMRNPPLRRNCGNAAPKPLFPVFEVSQLRDFSAHRVALDAGWLSSVPMALAIFEVCFADMNPGFGIEVYPRRPGVTMRYTFFLPNEGQGAPIRIRKNG